MSGSLTGVEGWEREGWCRWCRCWSREYISCGNL